MRRDGYPAMCIHGDKQQGASRAGKQQKGDKTIATQQGSSRQTKG